MKLNKLCLQLLACTALSFSSWAQLEIETGNGSGIQVDEAQKNTPDVKAETEITNGDDTLSFLAGDLFTGNLKSINNNELTWTHPESKNPLVFATKNFNTISLSEANEDFIVKHRITLSNGDVIPCQLISLTEEEAHIKTWFAGEFKVLRPMIHSIQFEKINDSMLLAKMPKKQKDFEKQWKRSGSWKMEDGKITTKKSGYISKKLDKSDKLAVSFRIERQSTRSNTEVYICTDANKGRSSKGYIFRFSQNNIQVRVDNSHVGYLYFPNHETMNNFDVKLYIDKEAHKIVALINDQAVQGRLNNFNQTPKGNDITFASSSSNQLSISKILVKKWDGHIEIGSTEKKNKEVLKNDKVVFANSDSVSGELQFIKDGQASFKTDFATMNIPVDRMSQLQFSDEELERARRNKGDVSGTIANGIGKMTFTLLDYNKGRFRVESENFGEIFITRKLFSELNFNIYRKKKE